MAASSYSLSNTTLSTAQVDAVATLAAGNSVLVTASQVGVHRATVHNWLKLPEFKDLLEQARRDHAAFVDAKLREITELALDTIRHTLTDPAVPPSVKLRAALAVIDRPLFPRSIDPLPQHIDEELTPSSHPGEPAFLSATCEAPEIARNAPCPCGSGSKYKRCCGMNAPPLLGRAA